MSYKPTIEEQETIIRIDRLDDKAYIHTTDSTMITKLSKVITNEGSEWELVESDKYSMRAIAPRNLISLRTKTYTREMTDEQRAEAGERLRKLQRGK
ncbi:MAG: hypothetical protein GX787_07385 [Tissierellia bacterium]|nr:hypothetical protein [Tissierellia bacterium]